MTKSGIAFILSATILAGPAYAGFEFSPPEQRAPMAAPVSQAPAYNGILTPEPGQMPALAAVPVTAEPLAPPVADRVVTTSISRGNAAGNLQINPNPLARRIAAPANQPFDGEALLDATILGEAISLAPEGKTQKAVREIEINPYPMQSGSATHDAYDVSRLEQGMMEGTANLRPIKVPGHRNVTYVPQTPEIEEYKPLPMPARKPAAPPVPMAAPSAQTVENDFAQAVGFGRDLPLALALSQVIPADYTYSFGQNVDLGTTVSWQGGKPWNEVLRDMLSQTGLKADISGNQVSIKSANS